MIVLTPTKTKPVYAKRSLPNTIPIFPPKIIERILLYVGLTTLRLTVPLVCRQWHDIAQPLLKRCVRVSAIRFGRALTRQQKQKMKITTEEHMAIKKLELTHQLRLAHTLVYEAGVSGALPYFGLCRISAAVEKRAWSILNATLASLSISRPQDLMIHQLILDAGFASWVWDRLQPLLTLVGHSLVHLHLENFPAKTIIPIALIMECCSNLKHLFLARRGGYESGSDVSKLEEMDNSDKEANTFNWPLQSITLDSLNLTQTALEPLLQRCPDLTELRIVRFQPCISGDVSSARLENFLFNQVERERFFGRLALYCPKLASLHVSEALDGRCGGFDEVVPIPQFPLVEQWGFSTLSMNRMPPRSVKMLLDKHMMKNRLTSIEILIARSSNVIMFGYQTDRITRSVPQQIWACRRLRTLHVRFDEACSTQSLDEQARVLYGYVSRVCPDLEDLLIRGNGIKDRLQSPVSMCLLSRLKRLKKLRLVEVPYMCEKDLDWIKEQYYYDIQEQLKLRLEWELKKDKRHSMVKSMVRRWRTLRIMNAPFCAGESSSMAEQSLGVSVDKETMPSGVEKESKTQSDVIDGVDMTHLGELQDIVNYFHYRRANRDESLWPELETIFIYYFASHALIDGMWRGYGYFTRQARSMIKKFRPEINVVNVGMLPEQEGRESTGADCISVGQSVSTRLPPEVIERIFSYLSQGVLRFYVSLVCRQCRPAHSFTKQDSHQSPMHRGCGLDRKRQLGLSFAIPSYLNASLTISLITLIRQLVLDVEQLALIWSRLIPLLEFLGSGLVSFHLDNILCGVLVPINRIMELCPNLQDLRIASNTPRFGKEPARLKEDSERSIVTGGSTTPIAANGNRMHPGNYWPLRSVTFDNLALTQTALESFIRSCPHLVKLRLIRFQPISAFSSIHAESIGSFLFIEQRRQKFFEDVAFYCPKLIALHVAEALDAAEALDVWYEGRGDMVAPISQLPNVEHWGVSTMSMLRVPTSPTSILLERHRIEHKLTSVEIEGFCKGTASYRINDNAKWFEELLCQSPLLEHFKAKEIRFPLRLLYVTKELSVKPKRTIVEYGEGDYEYPVVQRVWACRRLRTLHIRIEESHDEHMQDYEEQTRVVFGYISRVCPELEELSIHSTNLIRRSPISLCLLPRLKRLRILQLRYIYFLDYSQIDWMKWYHYYDADEFSLTPAWVKSLWMKWTPDQWRSSSPINKGHNMCLAERCFNAPSIADDPVADITAIRTNLRNKHEIHNPEGHGEKDTREIIGGVDMTHLGQRQDIADYFQERHANRHVCLWPNMEAIHIRYDIDDIITPKFFDPCIRLLRSHINKYRPEIEVICRGETTASTTGKRPSKICTMLSVLPTKTWSRILSFLGQGILRFTISLVCRQWHWLAQAHIRKTICISIAQLDYGSGCGGPSKIPLARMKRSCALKQLAHNLRKRILSAYTLVHSTGQSPDYFKKLFPGDEEEVWAVLLDALTAATSPSPSLLPSSPESLSFSAASFRKNKNDCSYSGGSVSSDQLKIRQLVLNADIYQVPTTIGTATKVNRQWPLQSATFDNMALSLTALESFVRSCPNLTELRMIRIQAMPATNTIPDQIMNFLFDKEARKQFFHRLSSPPLASLSSSSSNLSLYLPKLKSLHVSKDYNPDYSINPTHDEVVPIRQFPMVEQWGFSTMSIRVDFPFSACALLDRHIQQLNYLTSVEILGYSRPSGALHQIDYEPMPGQFTEWVHSFLCSNPQLQHFKASVVSFPIRMLYLIMDDDMMACVLPGYVTRVCPENEDLWTVPDQVAMGTCTKQQAFFCLNNHEAISMALAGSAAAQLITR
ncbi:hypothetical protein BX616_000953 [Lobosporangium transversale]|uniref:F-box domain-containing protein n=1 Tax=Lobosporangium transversale TaxID=64571 RepID=A0A1Y2H010_9FUNG|nr:hypothetical protein BCR41DRAFT_393585 [Lobosporangium transversale]KAF9917454.1 hypothetical protein BX616_000953 [Lobosporangium transversale]ORZ26402.1 hypothetical protein BCR41DRAFT_393585 [Lobosporangium transversale]|eukprot:XP_021884167.1 hypothetical protein BCR41DRAFT_393585 [Lobosporangium transversale]